MQRGWFGRNTLGLQKYRNVISTSTALLSVVISAVGMQPGICFGKETNLLTRLVFVVETHIYGRQKRFVLQAGTNVLALAKLWPESSGKRKHEKTKVFLREKSKFRGSKQTFLENVKPLKTNLFFFVFD